MATYSSNRLITGKEEIDIFSVSMEKHVFGLLLTKCLFIHLVVLYVS